MEMIVFGFKRHVNYGKNPSFKRIWIDPLRGHAEIRIVEHGSLDWYEVARRQPLIFWDRQPPQKVLTMRDVRIVWVPMWDGLIWKSARWWNKWSKYPIKIISYSRRLTRIAQSTGIPVFDIQYFDDPLDMQPVRWGDQRNAFYWNRTGLLNREHLVALCQALDLDHLFYRPTMDYFVPQSTQFTLPGRIGRTQVHMIPYLPHTEYLEIVGRTHLYIAPRWAEGVGVTVTEAMASGCVVLANNAPTMNEYVVHGETGIFLPYSRLLRHLIRFKSKLELRLGLDRPAPSPLVRYDWTQLLSFNLPEIGARARTASEEGRRRYMDALGPMLEFIFEW